MSDMKDFKCTYANSVGISEEVTEKLSLTFPDAYLHWDTMAQVALALKETDGAGFCELPFCHTVEAEAMGGLVNYGNEKTEYKGQHIDGMKNGYGTLTVKKGNLYLTSTEVYHGSFVNEVKETKDVLEGTKELADKLIAIANDLGIKTHYERIHSSDVFYRQGGYF